MFQRLVNQNTTKLNETTGSDLLIVAICNKYVITVLIVSGFGFVLLFTLSWFSVRLLWPTFSGTKRALLL